MHSSFLWFLLPFRGWGKLLGVRGYPPTSCLYGRRRKPAVYTNKLSLEELKEWLGNK